MEPVWLQRAREAGFTTIEVLSRCPMDEDRLPLYPIFQEGGLEALFALVEPAQRWELVQAATIRASKPANAAEGVVRRARTADVCQL